MSDLPELSGEDKVIIGDGIGGAITAGAIIGSIVPGPGTLIGAGIGAIVLNEPINKLLGSIENSGSGCITEVVVVLCNI